MALTYHATGMEILGFDTESKIVGTAVPGRKLTWEEIGNRSVRIPIPMP